MRIKHYDHIKSIDKKRDALHRALGSNTPIEIGKPPSSYDDEIASLYSEEAIGDTEESSSSIDVDMLNEELLNSKNNEDEKEKENDLENPRETIDRIKAEKKAIQKKLEENAIRVTNERVAELENKFENILNKLKSDSLILLNSLDMSAFKKEIAYFVVEFAEKDSDFKTKMHDLFDELETHKNKSTKKEVKKVKEKQKKQKVQSKTKDILMITFAALLSIAGGLYYLTGGKIANTNNKTKPTVKIVEQKTETNVKTSKVKNEKEPISKEKSQSDEIVTVTTPKEVNFLVETKNRFSIRCTNGYRKKFYHKKRLKGYIEEGRFYFKTKQDNTSLYCSTDELSIEKIF